MAAAKCVDSSSFWDIEDTQKYSTLLNNIFMSDVTFIIGEEGSRVYGHSFVLIPCSFDFYNAFKLMKLDNYEFIIKDVTESSFLAFLEYCYTFTLDLMSDTSLDKTMDILKLSQRFHMKTLQQICLKHVTLNLSTMNCMNIYKNRALFPADSSALNTALNYIGENFAEIVHVPNNIDIFVNLSVEEVIYIEKRCILITCDEKEWFEALIKWARRTCEKQNIPQLGKNLRMVLGDLFYKIPFPDMTPKCFLEIYSNYHGLLTMEEILRISRRINDNSVDCVEFKCAPWVAYDSLSRIILFGKPIQLFTGNPKMDQGTTAQMTSSFSVRTDNELLGFAYVAKRHEVVNVTCKLESSRQSFGYHDNNITAFPVGRYRITEEYDLIAIRFEHKYVLKNVHCTMLHCKFDKPVPNLSSGQVQRIHEQSIRYNVNEKNAIPYLIFSHLP